MVNWETYPIDIGQATNEDGFLLALVLRGEVGFDSKPILHIDIVPSVVEGYNFILGVEKALIEKNPSLLSRKLAIHPTRRKLRNRA